jgi:hypothetical protein
MHYNIDEGGSTSLILRHIYNLGMCFGVDSVTFPIIFCLRIEVFTVARCQGINFIRNSLATLNFSK